MWRPPRSPPSQPRVNRTEPNRTEWKEKPMSHDAADHTSPPRESTAFVPMADPIPGLDITPSLAAPPFPFLMPWGSWPAAGAGGDMQPCNIDLRDGCYRIAFMPT